jgi:hypothetical protein
VHKQKALATPQFADLRVRNYNQSGFYASKSMSLFDSVQTESFIIKKVQKES